MWTVQGECTCDAEVGSVKKGWRSCGRKATIQCISKYSQILHFCAEHEKRATEEGRTCAKRLVT